MNKTYAFPCPNCGSDALRSHFLSQEVEHSNCPNQRVISTSCSTCDYLMTMCSLDGRVIESSSPTFSVSKLSEKIVGRKVLPWPQRVSA